MVLGILDVSMLWVHKIMRRCLIKISMSTFVRIALRANVRAENLINLNYIIRFFVVVLVVRLMRQHVYIDNPLGDRYMYMYGRNFIHMSVYTLSPKGRPFSVRAHNTLNHAE